MKKLICVMSVCALVLGMAGCGKGQATSPVETYLYIGGETGDGFVMEKVELEALTPEALVLALAENGAIPEEVKVLSFEQDGEELQLDLSKEYQEYVSSCGTAGEWAAVGGLVNTFLEAYGAERITVLVEGVPLDSGHADYSGALSWY